MEAFSGIGLFMGIRVQVLAKLDYFRPVLKVHEIIMSPFAAPDKTFGLENSNNGLWVVCLVRSSRAAGLLYCQ